MIENPGNGLLTALLLLSSACSEDTEIIYLLLGENNVQLLLPYDLLNVDEESMCNFKGSLANFNHHVITLR